MNGYALDDARTDTKATMSALNWVKAFMGAAGQSHLAASAYCRYNAWQSTKQKPLQPSFLEHLNSNSSLMIIHQKQSVLIEVDDPKRGSGVKGSKG